MTELDVLLDYLVFEMNQSCSEFIFLHALHTDSEGSSSLTTYAASVEEFDWVNPTATAATVLGLFMQSFLLIMNEKNESPFFT